MFEAILLAAAVSVIDLPNPRQSGSWVVDQARLLTPAEQGDLNAGIDSLNRDLGVEVAIVTVEGVETTPKDFATALFKKWGVGQMGADNGLVVLMVRDSRRLETETGYGLEPILSDGWLGNMQNQVMVPRFRTGDFGGGLLAGMEAIDQRLRQNASEARLGSRRAKPVGSPNGAWIPMAVGGLATVGFGGIGLWLWRRTKCPKCGTKLILLSEQEEDEHLTKGQVREEAVGSVEYKVYFCTNCQFNRVEGSRHLLSGHETCDRCHFRTLLRRQSTLVAATYEHSGQDRLTEKCLYCQYRTKRVVDTPMLVMPVIVAADLGTTWGSSDSWSSDSSGSSDFGGGDSGGGGAGSDW